MAEYSFTPQFANLSGLAPLPAVDVTRGGELQFQPLGAIEVPSARPELVGQGMANALQSISEGLFGGIKAKYAEEKELEKEERKHQRALEIYGAKKKSENKEYYAQRRAEFIATNAGRADLPELLKTFDAAFSEFSGRVPESITVKKKEEKPLAPTTVEKPVAAQPEIIEPELPTPDYSIYPEEAAPISAAAEKPLQPLQVPTQVPEEIPVPPVLSGVPAAKPVMVTPTPEDISGVPKYLANQPQDPMQPRNLAGIEFMPNQKSQAFDAATKLTTPYQRVIAEQDERSGKWTLRQEDTSADVEKIGIDRARLVLEQNKAKIEAEKADRERLEAEKEKLRKDSTYLNSQKARTDDTLNNISLIDRAIELINQNPESVGVISKIFQEGKPLPVIGDIGGWSKLAAASGFTPSKERLQKIEDVAQALESVKANIGWDKLGEMKALSPTGASGAGALSDPERQSLQATKGSLEQSQSLESLLYTLHNIRSGVIKSTGNAISAIREVEPTYTPIASLPTLELTPDEQSRLASAVAKIESTPESEKQTEEYKKALKQRDDILSKYERIKRFNEKYFLQY
jgi:hypothetical protein